MKDRKENTEVKRRGGRVAALALALVMVLTVVMGALGMMNVHGTTPDSYQTAASLMASLGVISADCNGSYNLDQNVTRKQFVKMLVDVSPYKDEVMTGIYSAPYKDVEASDWSAPYIRVAVNNRIFSGYSDGTFRPDSTVNLAQAVNSVLLLLGYEQSDFRGAFPFAQMNLYKSTGLSSGISKTSASSVITRGEAVQLLYNLMKTNVKDGSQKYAQKLGYSVNSSGEIDYASVISENMYGPYTVTSAGSWASDLGVDKNNITVYKNGSLVSADVITAYDILYYTSNKDTVYVYSTKITGIYEKATPSQNNLTSVLVSGKTYHIESTAAFAALSSGGTVKIGDAVTLLIGKDGGVADAVLSADVDEDVVFYVTETGEKSYEDGNGNKYTSDYIKGISAGGNEYEYAYRSSTVEEGDVVRVQADEDGIRISRVSGNSIYGTVSASKMSVGASRIADHVMILDTFNGSTAMTSIRRLDGLSLSSSDVLYAKTENGEITELILDNVTGDALDYGLVLSAESNGSGMNLSGSYTYDLDGTTQRVNTQNSTMSVSKGPAGIYTSSGSTILRNLSSVSGTVTTVGNSSATIAGYKYLYSPEVKIYVKEDYSSDYRLGTVNDVITVFHDSDDTRSIRFYQDFDKNVQNGSRIRVITIG